MKTDIREKLQYLLRFMDLYMERSINDVLCDSLEDPQYSAVTTSNLIKCYIDVMQALGESINYHSVDEYMSQNMFTSEEIQLFNAKRNSESEYYIGKQY